VARCQQKAEKSMLATAIALSTRIHLPIHSSPMVKRLRIDQDSPWKQILRQYFPQALQFFFPQIAALIDWRTPPEFLDKEFQQIARKAKQGKRYADCLVKVKLLNGQTTILLVHVEVQAAKEAHFPTRMFTYNIRIFDYLGQPAVSLAILCDSDPTWRPHQYQFQLPLTQMQFDFGIVKLLDYQQQWTTLEASHNPFATVVMAHLKNQATTRKLQERKTWKFALIRRLYAMGMEQQIIRDLYRFLDWVMILPDSLEAEFWEELKAFEESQQMTYVTNAARIEYQRGKQEGKQEGEQDLVLRLLTRKVGEVPEAMRSQVQSLSLEQLEALGEALLDFTTPADLEAWLSEYA
jgi:Domain of unknown function (DUF4351)